MICLCAQDHIPIELIELAAGSTNPFVCALVQMDLAETQVRWEIPGLEKGVGGSTRLLSHFTGIHTFIESHL